MNQPEFFFMLTLFCNSLLSSLKCGRCWLDWSWITVLWLNLHVWRCCCICPMLMLSHLGNKSLLSNACTAVSASEIPVDRSHACWEEPLVVYNDPAWPRSSLTPGSLLLPDRSHASSWPHQPPAHTPQPPGGQGEGAEADRVQVGGDEEDQLHWQRL